MFESPPERLPRLRGAVIGFVGVLVAVAGFAFFGGDIERSDAASTEADSPPTSAVPPAERVPGLTGTVHAILATETGGRYVAWDTASATPDVTSLPVRAGRFNAHADQIASFDRPDDVPHGNLWIGPPDHLSIAVSSVTGFAWHDEDPAKIAVTRLVDGAAELWMGRLAGDDWSFVRLATLPDGSRAQAMGDWGVAVRRAGSRGAEVLVLDAYGSLLRQYRGTAVGQLPGPDGGLIVDPGEGAEPVLATLSGETEVIIPAGGVPLFMGWPTDGGNIAALVDDNGATVLRVFADRTIVNEFPLSARQVRWSPEGRFIVASTTTGGVTVVDTAQPSVTDLEIGGSASDVMLTG